MNANDAIHMVSCARLLVQLSLKIGDVNPMARSYHNLGIALNTLGQREVNQKHGGGASYREAVSSFAKALGLADQVTDDKLRPALLIRSNLSKGDAHHALGQDDLAEIHWLSSLAAARDEHATNPLTTLLNDLGSLYWGQGRLDKKAAFFESQRTFFKDNKMAECVAWCDYYLAPSFPPERQISTLKVAISDADAFDPDRSSLFRANALHQLDLAYGNEGLFEEDIDVCDQAEQTWQKRFRAGSKEGLEDLAECRNNRARAYLNLGDYRTSLKEFDRALSLKQRDPSNTTLWLAIERNRTLTQIAFDTDRSEVDLPRAEELAKQTVLSQQTRSHTAAVGDAIVLAGIALRRGDEARIQGHPAEAQRVFNGALDFLEKDTISTAENSGQGALGLKRLFQGALQLESGQTLLASETLLKAKQNLEYVQNRHALGFCLPLLAVAQDRAGRTQQAEETFQQAVTQFEVRQSRITSPQRMGPFQFVQASTLYADYADFLARTHSVEEAILMADRARARGLAHQALTLVNKGTDESHRKELETLWTAPLTPEELHRLVRTHPDTLFLHYNIGRNETTLLAFGDQVSARRFPLGIRPLALTHQIDEWLQNLIMGGPDADEERLARGLGKTLLGPLYSARLLSPMNGTMRWHRLVIIPDGALHNVPFAALLLPEASASRLIDRLPYTMTLSLKQLARQGPTHKPKKGMLVVCDPTRRQSKVSPTKDVIARQGSPSDPPLPAAVCHAADVLVRGYHGNVKYLVGSKARKRDVYGLLPDYALLMFVTHGHASEEQSGLASYLTLAPEEERPSERLEAGEILVRPLSAQMALLMACETAQGRLAGGEGSQGFVWAFWAAGCPSVTASLWRVDSEVCGKLLLAFWAGLEKGRPKDEALRTAILAIRKFHPHPVDWAAFQVYGDTEPLQKSVFSPFEKQ